MFNDNSNLEGYFHIIHKKLKHLPKNNCIFFQLRHFLPFFMITAPLYIELQKMLKT